MQSSQQLDSFVAWFIQDSKQDLSLFRSTAAAATTAAIATAAAAGRRWQVELDSLLRRLPLKLCSQLQQGAVQSGADGAQSASASPTGGGCTRVRSTIVQVAAPSGVRFPMRA